ncbi:MAG TPA: undecaprenyldiphospho-muramoylpentapeptide beta-N-acetylglucosaminyltransferase [Candidatus Binataceae bacterium]|nr:undecaprenyldiphospho-muramoylpentapeptide beta-N-acetylglucosaminyltransferase [Candidatus Binataceae bacterium]
MKMVISGGGTGGHLSPALALGEELKRMRPDAELRFIGTSAGLDRQFLSRSGFPYELLDVGGVAGHSVREMPIALLKMVKATFRARALLKVWKPELVVGVGGYASMPAAVAALSLRIPLLLMEQNTRPGLTNRVLARFARRICVAFEDTLPLLPRSKVQLTGNPVRFTPVNKPHQQPGLFSILVLGGSSGAHRLNLGALKAFEILNKDVMKFQIVHQTGAADEGLVRSAYQQAGIEADVVSFIYTMAEAFAQADLVVARSGAMTVSEIALAGCPAIFVPYPFHRDRQQEHNARTLERQGGALIVPDDEKLGENLARAIRDLAADRPRLNAMAERAEHAAKPDAAAAIAKACLEIVQEAA